MNKNDIVTLAVNGTLMRGLELENNLEEVNAQFLKESRTERAYRLFSINDKYPAMIKDAGGAAIEVELYSLEYQGLETILSKEPPGLTIDKIRLIDGSEAFGVVGLPFIIVDQKEITSYGGWRNYLKTGKEKAG